MLFQFQFIAIKDDKSILTAKVQNLFRFQTYDSKKHRKKIFCAAYYIISFFFRKFVTYNTSTLSSLMIDYVGNIEL